jgi:hypothetical protein
MLVKDLNSRLEDVANFERRYPTMKRIDNPLIKDFFRGYMTLRNEEGKYIYTFYLSIHFIPQYPFTFPKVIEVGNEVPKIMDRHVYPSYGNLCFATWAEEQIICMQGITSISFVEDILKPRLAVEYRVLHGEDYLSGYDHDLSGFYQFYNKYFDLKNRDDIIMFLELVCGIMDYPNNIKCFCSSYKKYKSCHKDKVNYISSLGRNPKNPLFWEKQLQIFKANKISL